MRDVWKGPHLIRSRQHPRALRNANRAEEFQFRLLRSIDLSPVNYKRVAKVDGQAVPCDKKMSRRSIRSSFRTLLS